MRNLAAKVPGAVWTDSRPRVNASYWIPSQTIARDLALGVVGDYKNRVGAAQRAVCRVRCAY